MKIPDVTFRVEMPEELKKQLEDLQKNSGLRTEKDFMQQLVNVYLVEELTYRMDYKIELTS